MVASLGEAITGLGMGLSATTILVMVQAAVPWQRRAVATGLVQFSRTIGGAVGVGLLGGIVTAAVGNSSAIVLDPIGRNFIPAARLAAMRSSLSGGLEWVFIILAVDAVVVTAVAIRLMPTVRIERRTAASAAAGGESGGRAGAERMAGHLNPRQATKAARHHRHGLRVRIHEHEAAAQLEGGDARGSAAGEEVEDQGAGRRGGLHDAPQDPQRFLRRIAGLLRAARRHDGVPPGVGGQLAARRLLRPHQTGRHVGNALDRLGVEHVGRRVPGVEQDVVVLGRPSVLRAAAVVVGPDHLVEKASLARRSGRGAPSQ